MGLIVADTEAVGDLLTINFEDETEPVRALGALPGREITHDPSGWGILGILQQEVPIDGILARDRDELIRKPDLNKKLES